MILAILQARFSSTRLPGKVLKPILGKEMLLHQVERIQHSKLIDKLVVATSIDGTDDVIEKVCLNNGIEVFRGNLNNVLDRFYKCAKIYNPLHIVRLTGDCPLIDWEVIDNMIEYYLNKKLDYISTFSNFPDGLDAEVIAMGALIESKNNATLPSEKEHVTQYINQRKNEFNIGSFVCCKNLSHLRWTVDEPEDFILVEKIYQKLYKNNPNFLTNDILKLIEKNVELETINNHFLRNEGLKKSLKEDEEFLKKNV
jgi:spore coat polysaccharide biosynthesis protein SpsF